MAAAYIKVYVFGECIRIFGGNRREVREMRDWYQNCNFLEFRSLHPWTNFNMYLTRKVTYHVN